MRRLIASFFLVASLAACGRSGGGDDPSDSTPTPTPTPSGDEAIFEAMLAGETPAAQGIAAVAASDGWPIDTETGFVFVRTNGGQGPYSLAGDHDAWAGAEMTLTNGFWWIRVEIDAPNHSIYKFVDGLDVYEVDSRSRRFGYDEFGEYSIVAASTGERLERWFDVTDGVVEPRTVSVRVPPAASTHHLYVHDGQNLFDPNAPYGGWKLDSVLGVNTLAVGIDNTSERMEEYTHVTDDIGSGTIGGEGDAYADFVQETVRPMIEAQYGAPTVTGTMGSSLGGLIAFHLALRHDGDWDFAASLSGTMGWGSLNPSIHNETMIEREVAAGHGTTRLYIDSGGTEGSGCVDSDADGIKDDTVDSSDNYCENRQLADALPSVGYTFDVDLWHWHEPGAQHNEAAWAARVFRPIDLFESL